MTIWNYRYDDGYDGRRRSEQQLLAVDLLSGQVAYGRMGVLDIGPVDLEMICNIVLR